MSELYTSDTAAAGIWRGLVVKSLNDGRAYIYIPTLHRKMKPFIDMANPADGIVEGCEKQYPIANSCCWKVRTPLNTGDAVWIAFENGNINYPVILGNFGTVVPEISEITGGGGTSYSYVEGISEPSNFYTIYNYLTGLGFNMAGACGILGNMKCENGAFDPAKDVPDSGGTRAIGICMFNTGGAGGPNYSNLKAHCGSYAYNSLEGQLEFLKYELIDAGTNTKGVKAANDIKKVANSTEGAYEAAKIFCQKYEVCASRDFFDSNAGSYASLKDKYSDSSKFDSIASSAGSNTAANVMKRALWAMYYFECFKNAPTDAADLPIATADLSDKQRKVLEFAQTYKGVGKSAKTGYCQAWVADVYSKALGIGRSSQEYACLAGDIWGKYSIEGFPDYFVSDSKPKSTNKPKCKLSQVPIGSCIWMLWSGYSGYPGHAVIYVGNGNVIGNNGGSSIPTIKTLQSFVDSGYKGFVWGWNGNVSLI